MAYWLIHSRLDNSGIYFCGVFMDVVASKHTQVVCAASFHFISDSLVKWWEFSLPFNVSMHQDNSYLDIHVWFFVKYILHNFPMLSIPLYGSHNVEFMFNALVVLLDSLDPYW